MVVSFSTTGAEATHTWTHCTESFGSFYAFMHLLLERTKVASSAKPPAILELIVGPIVCLNKMVVMEEK